MSGGTEARIAERWHDVAGRRVRSLEAGGPGGGEAPVVVVVPGLGALGYLLDTLAGCAAWARAYLLDVPGFGHRRPAAGEVELPAMVRLVAAWLGAVPGRPVVLAGHSTGAQVALHVAASLPGRVEALTLLGPVFPPEQRTVAGVLPPFLRTLRHEPLGAVPATLPYYVRGGVRAMARFIRSGQQDAPEAVAGGVSCPVLVARGAQDALAPAEWAERLAGAAARGRAVTVPGAHAFPFRRGGLTAALIADVAAEARSGRDRPGGPGG
ncbi:alpha/beta fold hydrolase [Actinomadura sp. ATCC 31491]|uniref:Alpha/beta fold hydrolase n=1 Tax=Actinomadura luzonensis TaxID=2805427 RepID=A0ABT0FND4_9ACTN|nr:alpha/beta fold hydrolase [Actinomadura luzonensis]MCK2213403.1 alpha/beta fold hydrolase [Actinomadura luzonensis]